MLKEKQKGDYLILAVSPDTSEESKNMIEKTQKFPGEFDFPLLSDADHQVIDRYGLLNPKGRGPQGRRIPHPAVYLIDKGGVVRWRFVETDYKIRASHAMILKAISALESTTPATSHPQGKATKPQ